MKRKATEPDNEWLITPIPRIARKKRKEGNLISPTQVSSAPPTPYKWDIPPTPPKGENEDGTENTNEGIQPISCERCQMEFSNDAILGLHECNIQTPLGKRRRGRPKKKKVEDSLLDVSQIQIKSTGTSGKYVSDSNSKEA